MLLMHRDHADRRLRSSSATCLLALKRFVQGSVASAMHFAFTGATRMSRRRECPSQKAERRCCYGGGAAGRRASRDGPSMTQHGSPGIHAGRPTTQNLLSASRRAGRSKTSAKTRSTARRGGLQADLFSEAHFSEQAGWQQSIYRATQCRRLKVLEGSSPNCKR